MKHHITLICTPLTFYTHKDEDALFEWLYKISCITKIQGIGRNLHIVINTSKITPQDIYDFIGIFKRYKFKNYKQLQQLYENCNEDIEVDYVPQHQNIYPHKTIETKK